MCYLDFFGVATILHQVFPLCFCIILLGCLSRILTYPSTAFPFPLPLLSWPSTLLGTLWLVMMLLPALHVGGLIWIVMVIK